MNKETIKTSIQIGAFAILCGLLCLKPTHVIHKETVIVYRDTCDSEFISKIAQIETGGNDSTVAENGQGRGRYGIYDICVTGTGLKSLLGFTHADMNNPEMSTAVFWAMMGIFCYVHHQKHGIYPTYEELARKWAGGPNGDEKQTTLKYLNKYRTL
jgi:hypothetical protein